MPVIYRTDDATRWGTGKGANLTPVEVDGNFWDLAERLAALEAGGASPNGIANIAVTGSQMTVWLEDGTALGPYTLPTAMIRYRGDWVSGAAYAELDLVAVPDAGIYLVLRDHTAAATFDASATDASGNQLYRWLFPMSGRALDDLSDVSAAAPADGEVLGYDAGATAWTPRAPGVPEAPADGATYGRLNGAWSALDLVPNWADIPDKPATFPPDAHTHSSSEISDFPEGVQDTVGAMVVGGTSVTVTYDDAGGTLTIDASGGGAGALDDLSDVAITTPAVAQVLRHDGMSWVNAALGWADLTGKPATIDAIPGPIGLSGQVLKVQSDGTIAWVADDTGTGGGASVSDEGAQVLAAPTDLNFAGAGVSVTDDGDGTVTITVTGGSASALNDLSDVTIATPAAAQFVRYSGTEWVNAVVDWADLANVPATFPPDPHTHPSGEISDFSEAVDDRVAALLVAGTNVTLTYDDAAGTLTVDASGSGGASALGDLSDVTLTTPAAADFIRFDGTGWVNAIVGWADVASKPATFPPDAHTHDWGEVTGRPATVDALPSPVGAAGEVMKAQGDGTILWQAEAGGLADAPADGSTYARKDAAWVSIPIEPEEGAYKYWRVRLISEDQLSGTNSVYLGEIEFRSQAGIAEQATGGTIIGDMGSRSKLFDGVKNATSDGASTDPPYTDKYAGYIFPEAKKVNQIAIFAAKNLQPYVPQRFVIEASHDGVAWDEVARADPSGTYYSYTPYLTTPEVPPDQVDWPNVLNKLATVDALPGPVGTDGQVLEAQADGSIIWAAPGGLADAPADGTFYGRNDGAWANLPQGAGSGVDADLLDGQEGAFYQDASNLNAGRFVRDRLPATVGALNDALLAMPGLSASDLSMTGLYDRNELTLADKRGTVAFNFTGAGVAPSDVSPLFNATGDYASISGTDATTTRIEIVITLDEPLQLYGNTHWQPFFQYRLGMGGQVTWYNRITVEASDDGVTWYRPAGGEWETLNANAEEGTHGSPGLWMGKLGGGNLMVPGNSLKYIRFVLEDRQADPNYAYTDYIWISQLGFRHRAAPYARQYIRSDGGEFYGGYWAKGATGDNQGDGTINAKAVFDDGTLLCAPIEEVVAGRYNSEEWAELEARKNLPDRAGI